MLRLFDGQDPYRLVTFFGFNFDTGARVLREVLVIHCPREEYRDIPQHIAFTLRLQIAIAQKLSYQQLGNRIYCLTVTCRQPSFETSPTPEHVRPISRSPTTLGLLRRLNRIRNAQCTRGWTSMLNCVGHRFSER